MRKAKKIVPAEVPAPAKEVETTNTGAAEAQDASTSAGVKPSFDVYNDEGVLMRTYSVEVHGEDAEALANEFASHTGGKVV